MNRAPMKMSQMSGYASLIRLFDQFSARAPMTAPMGIRSILEL